MLCPNCGTDVSSAGCFCPNCGTPLQASKPAMDTAPQPQYQQPQYQQPQYQQPQYQQPQYQQPQYQQPQYQQPQYQQPQYQQPQYQQPQYQQPYQPMQPAAPQMNWYKFLIYFALFAGAVVNAINAVRFLTGVVNGAESEMLYSFLPSWQVVDIIVGLLLIVTAAASVFTRFRLSGYYKNGPACLYLTYGLAALSNVVYLIGVSLVISGVGISLTAADIVPTVTSIVVSIVMIVVNVVYFNKRKYLFNK